MTVTPCEDRRSHVWERPECHGTAPRSVRDGGGCEARTRGAVCRFVLARFARRRPPALIAVTRLHRDQHRWLIRPRPDSPTSACACCRTRSAKFRRLHAHSSMIAVAVHQLFRTAQRHLRARAGDPGRGRSWVGLGLMGITELGMAPSCCKCVARRALRSLPLYRTVWFPRPGREGIKRICADRPSDALGTPVW